MDNWLTQVQLQDNGSQRCVLARVCTRVFRVFDLFLVGLYHSRAEAGFAGLGLETRESLSPAVCVSCQSDRHIESQQQRPK